jgi:hypothetical protein
MVVLKLLARLLVEPFSGYSIFSSLIAPFFLHLQYHLNHPPDGFRP